MRSLIYITALLFTYILAQVVRTGYYIRVGEKLAADAIPFSQHPPNPSLRILMVGDSTGVGTGASSSSTSIAGRVGKRYPTADITNIAVNGAKTHEVIPQLQSASGTFDLIMIEIGGNDAVRFTNLDQLAHNLQAILTLASKKGTHILVTSTGNIGTVPLFPAPTRWIFQRRTQKVRAVFLKQIALQDSKNIRYTDLYRSHTNDPFAQDPKTYYAADSFHPSDAGYQDWFTLISKELDHFPL